MTGKAALGNTYGIFVRYFAHGNWIGTNGDGVNDEVEGNIISANGTGVRIEASSEDPAGENVVAGNFIGTDVAGTLALGNKTGVDIRSSRSNRIGTNGDGVGDEAERNVISANRFSGIQISGVGSDGNVVAGNLIGTDVTGTAALGNALQGVRIEGGARSNRIGTNGDGVADAAERNVLSANQSDCLLILGVGTDFNIVAGNFIGTDVTGTVALANRLVGVGIGFGPKSNLVGTNGDGVADEAERNVISGNLQSGLVIRGIGSDRNIVAGNLIGTDVSGNVAMANGDSGVVIIRGPRFNRVGTNGDGVADDAERNVVSGNVGVGVVIRIAADSNVVAGNYIGTDASGSSALGNTLAGVAILNGAKSNRIGTNGDGLFDSAERNLISGNGLTGVGIRDAGSNQNLVAGNFVGTDATGTAPLGNGLDGGVLIFGGAQANQIGGGAALGNKVAFNRGPGVWVVHAGSTGNLIRANTIQTNGGLGIDLGGDVVSGAVGFPDGVTPNDTGDADTGPNNFQNFPVISSVQGGLKTRVVGTLNSLANTTFTLDVYANAAADPSGFGEGERHLGSAPVTTDANGDASYDVVLNAASASGEFITATATDPDGNTSEFSSALVISVLHVDIDIKPGSFPNAINLGSNGVLPVAILTTAVFDATKVDTSTIKFGDTRACFARVSALRTAIEDVDGDGDLDLVVFFSIPAITASRALDADSVDAVLTAKTLDGTDIFGVDSVLIVPH